jgi:CRISPR-associated protein Cas1
MANTHATHRRLATTTARPSATTRALISAEDVIDGHDAARRTYTNNTDVGETVVLDGYGLAVRVNRGELVCVDGDGGHRRQRRIARSEAAAGRLRRVLVLGEGIVTTDAVAWCAALGVALVVVGPAGEPLMIGAPELYAHGGLRQAQALAPFTEVGIATTRWLLDRRLADQARITRDRLGRADRAAAIHELRGRLVAARNPAEAVLLEMQAAEQYWAAWADEVRMSFRAQDRARIPERWTRFSGRSSPLAAGHTNRHAASPVTALVNYGSRLAEIEATIACRAMGLDPAMGLAHAPGLNRLSMVLDLIEPARSTVEETVLRLSGQRNFRKADFAENANGEVRVLAPLSHDFAQALLPELRRMLAPVAEHVTQMLADLAPTDVRPPTALSRSRHRQARANHADAARNKREQPTPAALMWACPDCSGQVTNTQHVRCESCIAADPRQTGEVRGRRAKAIAARRREADAWKDAGGLGTYDPDAWPQIQAGLINVKLAEIVAVTGFSKSFASVVRAGKSRPHPSSWPALQSLGAEAQAAKLG